MSDDKLYLLHIDEAISRIGEYTAEGKSTFFADRKTQDAVLRNLQTVAESTQRLSDGLKAQYPSIDWQAIAAFRNVVVHRYLAIDLEQIWSIVVADLPPLKAEVKRMLDEFD